MGEGGEEGLSVNVHVIHEVCGVMCDGVKGANAALEPLSSAWRSNGPTCFSNRLNRSASSSGFSFRRRLFSSRSMRSASACVMAGKGDGWARARER